MSDKIRKASVYFENARNCQGQGDLDEAEREYREGLALEPAAHDVYIELGKICVEKKAYEKALVEYGKALEYFPRDPTLCHEIGRIYSRMKEYRLAIDEYKKARAYGSSAGYLGLDLGFAYKEIGEYENSLKELDGIPAGCVANVYVHLLKGENYTLLGNYDRSEDEFKKVLQCDPGNEQANRQLSIIYRHKAVDLLSSGKWDEAIDICRAAISCRPGESWLHLGLGKSYALKGEYDQAINAFNAGLAYTPDDWELRYELGMCYVQKKQYNDAIVELEHAAKLNPDNHVPILEQGVLLAKGREYGRATEALNDAADRMEKRFGRVDVGTFAQNHLTPAEISHSRVNARKAFVNKFINKAEYFDAMECFSKPLLLWFFLTYRCNLTCIMCGRGRNESAILPFEVFEKLSDWIPYAQRIEWQGGEAFLAEYFRDLVIRVGETYPYIAQSITTNGLLITEEWTKILARLKVDMYFSIDAVVKDTYENIRKGGSFERLTRNLEAMNNEYSKLYDDSEYGFNANVIVMKSNAGQLGLIPEFCKKYGIRTIRFNYLDPVVSPEEDLFAERNNEAVERLRGSISEVKEKCRELGIQFKCFLPPLQRENEKREKLMPGDMTCRASGKEYLLPCRRPWTDLLFHPDGTVQPGCACYAPVGNILSDSMEYIWNGNMMKLYRKHLVEGTPDKICSKHCLKGLIP